MRNLRARFGAAAAAVSLLASACGVRQPGPGAALRFSVSFPAGKAATPLDGRLILVISTGTEGEPRFQISDESDTQQVFGIDVEGLAPGSPATIDSSAFGYPRRSLSDVPAGEYTIQAVLHRYETFRRSDGAVVKLPMDRGEGQRWNEAPGNLFSTPRRVRIDPASNSVVPIVLDQAIPPLGPPADTKYIRHVRIQSRLLTEFWGRPMHLGAVVLLPEGFDSRPAAHYPLVIAHGHYSRTLDGFREAPPEADLKPVYSKRFRIEGYNRIEQEQAHQFYKDWTSPGFPRFLLVEVQHANPYYDDSYAVNSANLGPYGDAINRELLPFVEKQFRALGAGWARFTWGGSTGGWEALATQVFYPDDFNGCFAACPDPIDFRAFTVINLYEDRNAYFLDGPWKRTPRPGKRDYLGHLGATVEQMNHRELALGTHSRSGDQWDAWEAVFSPVGADGYPKRIWDKLTGRIDPEVAAYWRERYDLGHILKRDWKKLGPRLRGKIHLYCGDMDNYYLNNAVYLVEEFLKGTADPTYDGVVDYGDRAEHCWNGDHTRPIWLSRLRYAQFFAPMILERLLKTAPAGADVTSWRY
jgi:hypothetical protein